MKRYRCTVSYCGAAYSGWQSQRNGTSVQEQIESVLHDIAHAKINIVASGRTDAGVNASAQVFHFDTELEMTPRKWMGAINGHLPKDIHIMDVQETDHLFHARYCVRRKQYDYRINLGPYDVFTRDTAYQCPVKLDVEKMKEASKYLIGTHDFTSFNSNTLAETPNQIRTVYDIVFTREGNILKLSFLGKGFLRYMVRMMAAQLVEVGRGRLQQEDIQKMLEARSKTIARKNAPANGLTLEKVEYFEICALNEEVMIREYLADDKLPQGQTIDRLEKAVSENQWPREYIMTYRTSQEKLGTMRAVSPEKGCIVEVNTPQDLERAENLRTQLSDWLKKAGASESAEVQIRLGSEHN